MQTRLKERVSLRNYLQQLTKEVIQKEQLYNEELRIDPEEYIRNEYKIIYK